MSIKKIIQEAVQKNPLSMKEALDEELKTRIGFMLESKMEEVALDEAMKLDKHNVVDHDVNSEKFAKDYVKAHKGNYHPGGPTEKHEKDSEKFHNTYKRIGGKSGFGGSGHDIYQHNTTGEKFRIDRHPSGKGFYGTDHYIKKINEEAVLDETVEGSAKRNRELLSTGRISKDEFDRRMGYGKYKPKGPAGVGPLGKSLYKNLVKTNEEVELSEAETNYVIKHKKTKQVLNTHSDYSTAKDEHEGLGADKHEYGIYKQTKKDAALRNRNTYREEVEQIDEISKSTLGSYATKALNRADIAARMSHSNSDEMGKIAAKRTTGVKKAIDRLASKRAATSIKSNIDKAREAARNRGTDKDDHGKAYYAAQKGISKVREGFDLDEAVKIQHFKVGQKVVNPYHPVDSTREGTVTKVRGEGKSHVVSVNWGGKSSLDHLPNGGDKMDYLEPSK